MSDKEQDDATENGFWILAKRLDGSKQKKLKTSDLNELTSDFQYWAFSPQHSKDFVSKKVYGRIETRSNNEQWMYHHYILYLSGE